MGGLGQTRGGRGREEENNPVGIPSSTVLNNHCGGTELRNLRE